VTGDTYRFRTSQRTPKNAQSPTRTRAPINGGSPYTKIFSSFSIVRASSSFVLGTEAQYPRATRGGG
jgi:hypothetical protein